MSNPRSSPKGKSGNTNRPVTPHGHTVNQAASSAHAKKSPPVRYETSQGKGQLRRQQTAQAAQRRRIQLILGTLGAVVMIIGIFIVIANTAGAGTSDGSIGAVAPVNVVKALTTVPPSVLSAVKTGGLANPFQATSGHPPLITDSQGKPIVFYAGGDFCPFCAAERWSMIVALSRFGTFGNLHLMESSSSDSYPNTNTFTFVDSTYTSKYLAFQPVETMDRAGQPLQTFTADQQQWFNTYDSPPYTSTQAGIPFISFGNQYLTMSSGFLPDVLAGQSWQSIASGLSDPTNPATIAIVGNANYLTAGVCQLTQQQPASVCKTVPITAIQP